MNRTAALWPRLRRCAILCPCVLLPWKMAAAGVIHQFGSIGTGSMPAAPVIMDAAGHVYGTTQTGGAFGFGTVYEMTREPDGGWSYTDIYSFQGGADGGEPVGPLVFDSAGALYGNTFFYGSQALATAYKLSPPAAGQPAWTKTTLLTFPSRAVPYSGPTLGPNGTLYGTLGPASPSFGSIYQMSPASGGGAPYSLKILYDFSNINQGYVPTGNLLLDSKGYLTGVTEYGGNQIYAPGCGTVFQLRPPANGHADWTLKDIYRFSTYANCFPLAGVIADRSGALYGTTRGLGALGGTGSGTVFKLSPQGDGNFAFTTLYTFSATSAPDEPTQLVMDRAGKLFGISLYGGVGCGGSIGCGTLFGLSPPADGSTGWTETLLISAQHRSGNYPVALALGTDHHLYETMYLHGHFDGGTLIRQNKDAE